MKKKNLSAIVAVNKLNYIGLHGTLPWYSKEDLKFFKRITLGKNLIVGSVTYKKLPPLPGRNVYVLGKEYLDFDSIIRMINNSEEEFFVIGGKKTYELFLPFINIFYISRINDYTVGDTTFNLEEKIETLGINTVENNFFIN